MSLCAVQWQRQWYKNNRTQGDSNTVTSEWRAWRYNNTWYFVKYHCFQGSATVLCHKSGYSSYTSTSRHAYKRKSDSCPDKPGKRLFRSQVAQFDYANNCLFCGLICEPRDLKKTGRWDPVKQCQTVERPGIPTFKDVILSKCDERKDEWAKVVQLRVNGVVDLPAADALYHVKCYRKVPNDLRGNVTCKPVDDSLAAVISKMNADNLATWTVSELHTVYLANLGKLQKKQMLCNLCDYFGDDLLVIQVEGCSTIVGFRNHVGKMLKLVNQTETPGEYDYVDKLVRRVQAEVKDLPLPRNYDLGSFRHDRLVQDTSPTLLRLISSLVSRDEGVTKQSLTLTQCIQQHVSKSWNQTTLGLAIKLHHKHGSSEMFQTLNEHGILASYDEVLRFRKSAAQYASEDSEMYMRTIGLEKSNGPIHSWGDNFDLNVFTPNGCRSTHAMATQLMKNPVGIQPEDQGCVDEGVLSLNLPRLTKLEASKLHLAEKNSFIIEHYSGPKKMNPPDLPYLPNSASTKNSTRKHVSKAQQKDAAWLTQLHSSPLPFDWAAYNAVQDRTDGDYVSMKRTVSVLGPLLDSPPAHPDTVLSTIAYLDTSLKQLGMNYSLITFDMQLYEIACLVKWSDPERWSSVVLMPGMMHTLMSFIGCIGCLMKSTGLEELIGAS